MNMYLYGWYIFFRALKICRAKKHGAGKQPWGYAIKTASCARFIVDGQHRIPPRNPRWMKSMISTKSNG